MTLSRLRLAARLAAVCGIVVYSAAVSGCFLLPREELPPAPPLRSAPQISYRTMEARLGTIENVLTVSARFDYARSRGLNFGQRGGRIGAIHTQTGEDVRAGELLAELVTAPLRADIERQRLEVRKAELVHERSVATGADRFQREIDEMNVRIARLRLSQLERELEESRIYAPFDGRIAFSARVVEGDHVDAYRTVFQIADPRDLVLIYDGTDMTHFRTGMTVDARHRTTELTGEVIQTPATAPFDAPDDIRRRVIIRPHTLPDEVRAGDSATIELVLERQDDVVIIPRDYVQTYMGSQHVFVMEDGLRRERVVEVGIRTPLEIQIRRGLEPGEHVVAP